MYVKTNANLRSELSTTTEIVGRTKAGDKQLIIACEYDLSLCVEYYFGFTVKSWTHASLASKEIEGTTYLLGMDLNELIDRVNARSKLKFNGLVANWEDLNYYADLYDSSNVLSGTDSLTVFYNEGYIAKAQYRFPVHVNAQKIVDVKNLLESKYGQPDLFSGHVRVGNAKFVWNRNYGIRIEVS